MPIERIPFGNKQASSLEPLGGAMPVSMNVVLDPTGTLWRRPGITTYSGAPTTVVDSTGIAGLYSSIKGFLFAVGVGGAERQIYNVTSGGAASFGGGASGFGLRGSNRPVFAESDMIVTVAGGDAIEKILVYGSGSPVSSRLGGTPPNASFVIANASRLLANDVTVDPSAVRFSSTAGGLTSFAELETWTYGGFGTSGYFSAEVRPDPVMALVDTLNEVFVFGKSSLQVFVPDPQVTYAPVAASDIGITAPYSCVRVDDMLYWMDHQKRFVRGNGRSYEAISDEIQLELDSMTSFSDCYGFRVIEGWLDGIVWVFPTDGRTYFYQPGSGWGQWASWDDSKQNWAPYIVSAHTRLAGESHGIVGTTTGLIGLIDLPTTTDLGSRIRARVETGYINHKTEAWKHCRSVHIALKRGTTSSSTGMQASFGFRDRPGPWSSPIPIDLGGSGDTEIVLRFSGLGTYQRRQWFFEFAGTDDIRLVAASEEYDVGFD